MTCSTIQQQLSSMHNCNSEQLAAYSQSFSVFSSPTTTTTTSIGSSNPSYSPNMLPSVPRKRGRENSSNGGLPNSTSAALATSPRRSASQSMYLSMPPLHSGYSSNLTVPSVAPHPIHVSSLVSASSSSPYLQTSSQSTFFSSSTSTSPVNTSIFSSLPIYASNPSFPAPIAHCTPPSAKKFRPHSLSPATSLGISIIDIHNPALSPLRPFASASSPTSSPAISPSAFSFLERRARSYHDFMNTSEPSSPMPNRPYNLAPIHIPSPVSRGSSPSLSVFSSSPPTSITPLSLPTSASHSNPIDSFQALLPRFRIARTLQQSLFGCIKVAEDTKTRQYVAIKISRRMSSPTTTASPSALASATPRSASAPGGIAISSKQGDNTVSKSSPIELESDLENSNAPSLSTAGSSFISNLKSFHSTNESCRREAFLLKLIRDQDIFATSSTENLTITAPPLPSAYGAEKAEHERSLSVSPTNQDYGKRHLCTYITDITDETHHYLVMEYAHYGDMQHYLSIFSKHRIDESVASNLLLQLVSAVHSLHKIYHIAHLDLSLENLCLSRTSDLKIIDFGLAVLHPLAAQAQLIQSEGNLTNLPSLSHPLSLDNNSFDSYKCAPYPADFFPPGKTTYQSPEMYAHESWDAFAADVFAIGVIAYTLMTGHPPFHVPISTSSSSAPTVQLSTIVNKSIRESSSKSSSSVESTPAQASTSTPVTNGGDPWYVAISTGAWLKPEIKSQASASIYTHLSANALSFIDMAIKPEVNRATIDELLRHPFLQGTCK